MKCLFTVPQSYRYWPAIDCGNVDEEAASFQSARNARLPVDSMKTMIGILVDDSFQGLTRAKAEHEMVRIIQRLLSTFIKDYERTIGSQRFHAMITNLNSVLNNAPLDKRDYIEKAACTMGDVIDVNNDDHRMKLGKALIDDMRSQE